MYGLVVYIATMFLALYRLFPLSLSSLSIYLFKLKLLTRAAGVMPLHASTTSISIRQRPLTLAIAANSTTRILDTIILVS
ncbi:hypothetical protein VNO80_17131 [Phaseolus coccineus]|uniref:Uncharacterized protein n=1 Tax=Phaseolus coccineus TaxID=3886 RepID=A0AAN9MSL1_PHACN